MPSKCFASWASPNWTRPPRRRDKNRSCSDQPQNPPPYLLGVTGHNVKHALVAQPFSPQTGILEGKAVPVAEQVLVDSSTWRAAFAATDSGMLAYVAGGTATQ